MTTGLHPPQLSWKRHPIRGASTIHRAPLLPTKASISPLGHRLLWARASWNWPWGRCCSVICWYPHGILQWMCNDVLKFQPLVVWVHQSGFYPESVTHLTYQTNPGSCEWTLDNHSKTFQWDFESVHPGWCVWGLVQKTCKLSSILPHRFQVCGWQTNSQQSSWVLVSLHDCVIDWTETPSTSVWCPVKT